MIKSQRFPKSFILLLIIFASCNKKLYNTAATKTNITKDFKVVGYLSSKNFDRVDSIPLNYLTHLNLAFANPGPNGKLKLNHEENLGRVVERAHQARVKVFLSIAGGGIDQERAQYWLKVLQPENRKIFIKEILDFIVKHGLDGIDVDIENNLLPTITNLYTPFVVELKTALHTAGKGISTALNVSGLHHAITQEALEAYDFINIMVYDKTGPWRPEIPGPHAPFSYALEALDYWTQVRKIPAANLTLGVPFYGYNFYPLPATSMGYGDIVKMDPKYAYVDQVGSLFYNGIPTMVDKTELALKSFGGIMIWELEQDSKNDLSLLRAIHQTIMANDCHGTGVTTFFADFDSDGYGDLTKPLQACKAPKNYVQNCSDPNDSNINITP